MCEKEEEKTAYFVYKQKNEILCIISVLNLANKKKHVRITIKDLFKLPSIHLFTCLTS